MLWEGSSLLLTQSCLAFPERVLLQQGLFTVNKKVTAVAGNATARNLVPPADRAPRSFCPCRIKPGSIQSRGSQSRTRVADPWTRRREISKFLRPCRFFLLVVLASWRRSRICARLVASVVPPQTAARNTRRSLPRVYLCAHPHSLNSSPLQQSLASSLSPPRENKQASKQTSTQHAQTSENPA
jgi:hypothetical protein